MRRIGLIILILALILPALSFGRNEPFKHRLGVVYSLGNSFAGEKPNFTFNHGFGIYFGTGAGKWGLNFSLLLQNNYSDSTASGHFGFFADKSNADLGFKSIRAGMDVDYRFRETGSLRPKASAGLGYLVWKYTEPQGDTVIQVEGSKGNSLDFSAAEMYLSGGLGLEIRPARRLVFDLTASVDYLTGIGTDFADAVDDNRARMVMRVGIKLAFLFGQEKKSSPSAPIWPSQENWDQKKDEPARSAAERDSDGDGIIDRNDDCPNTPAGAVVNESGCPADSDGDGVLDGLDDCPVTPRTAAGYVDIFGCPIDTDYDGIPDYRDHCRQGPVGTIVDSVGCPLDSDGDGVYDGLDDCPETAAGIGVDDRGCIDISFLHEPMVINIDYLPGSFEVDERTKKRLEPLIQKLIILSDVKIKVIGYTDNVGPAEANQVLSQKRANRLRDWFESKGIERDRMTVIGRGETNFVTSNQTAEGRAKNRRIELVFEQ